ncbi:MAG: glycosyl hydrolase family 28-related protein, partial [Pseudomonadota bacterium]
MNKAITEGLDLMPPEFIDGLDVWSAEDGTPGTTTYATIGTLIADDPDFGPALNIQKTDTIQRLRYMGETPILPGCYLEVSARVKLFSDPFPLVRIAAFAGDASGDEIANLTTFGPEVLLEDVGRIYTVRAIVGTGERTGVDMVWGTDPVFGHFGIDILGDNGSVVTVESITVRDATEVFHRKLMDWIDVKDYGAVGDGITNDLPAFLTADAAAAGRDILVPEGTYFIQNTATITSRLRFEGTITQPLDKRWVMRNNFDYPSYVDAFGDETLALQKGLQALFGLSDHESFDLRGRRIQLDEPVDIRALNPTLNNVGARLVIRNGQFEATDSPGWDPTVVTSTASYAGDNSKTLTNVTNAANIEVGSLVTGFGVGREIYVRAVDVDAETITLNDSAGKAQASQTYTFTRWRYLLDFSGMPRINRFQIDDCEFRCNARANGVLLPDDGIAWSIRDCWFVRPRERAITSAGRACQGISIDRNQFVAADNDLPVEQRTSICFNVNANDAKVRDNRSEQAKTFCIVGGGGHIFVGNHFWNLDDEDDTIGTAGIVLTNLTPKTTIVGNYIDTMRIELSPEHRTETAALNNFEDIGQVTITGNIFTAQMVADWFNYIVIRPPGPGYWIEGLTIDGNTFENFNGGTHDRVD